MNRSNDIKLHRPVIITQNGEPHGVLQEPKSYKDLRNAIGMLTLLSQGETDIRNEKITSQRDVFEGIENALKEKPR